MLVVLVLAVLVVVVLVVVLVLVLVVLVVWWWCCRRRGHEELREIDVRDGRARDMLSQYSRGRHGCHMRCPLLAF